MTLEKRITNSTERENGFKYDIYLASPWERYLPEPFKQMFKEAFPDINIYDPEEHQDGDYFADDLEAISNSKYIVCYAPSFPMSACPSEIGYFYNIQEQLGLVDENLKCNNIVVIWDENIQPSFGKKWYERMGIVVSNTQQAIEEMKRLEPNWFLRS